MPSPIRFGFGFDLRNPPDWRRPLPDLYAETLDFIAATEQMGFEAVWLAEHHCMEDDYNPSPYMFGAAVAARTSKVRISSGVSLAPFYHPVRLAEDLAVLDNISNGRIEFAPGLGYLDWEAQAYGLDFSKRAVITNELLQIVRRLWEGETVTFQGEYFDITDAKCRPLPVQRPSIPIFIGGTARPGLRRAALYGDGYIGTPVFWPQYLEEVRALGKDDSEARISCMDGANMWLLVSEDPEKTLEEVAPHAYYQISMYAKWQEHKSVGIQKMDFETFKKSGPLRVLTPEAAIDFIRAQRELAPIETFCMQTPAGFPLQKLAEHADLFARKVIPAVNEP